jgi:FMN phosphatase YigB (HAD superfamily)
MASHECGRIPARRVELLRALGRDFRLGLVSDLWAPARRCRDYLGSLGLAGLFGSLVFSSEHGAVKPARQLFERALGELDADPARTLFVGDDLARDVAGAANCGLATVWIGEPERPNGADWVLRDVLELAV